jgi:hypothetical protein
MSNAKITIFVSNINAGIIFNVVIDESWTVLQLYNHVRKELNNENLLLHSHNRNLRNPTNKLIQDCNFVDYCTVWIIHSELSVNPFDRIEAKKDNCFICLKMMLNKEIVLIPCLHGLDDWLCYDCANKLRTNCNSQCPLCRKIFTSILQKSGDKFCKI